MSSTSFALADLSEAQEMPVELVLLLLANSEDEPADLWEFTKEWLGVHLESMTVREAGDVWRAISQFASVPQVGAYKDRLSEVCEDTCDFAPPLSSTSAPIERRRRVAKRKVPEPVEEAEEPSQEPVESQEEEPSFEDPPVVPRKRMRRAPVRQAPSHQLQAQMEALTEAVSGLRQAMNPGNLSKSTRGDGFHIGNSLRSAAASAPQAASFQLPRTPQGQLPTQHPQQPLIPPHQIRHELHSNPDPDLVQDLESSSDDSAHDHSQSQSLSSHDSHPKVILQARSTKSRRLQVTKAREAGGMLQQIRARYRTVSAYVQSTVFKVKRNQVEAQVLSRAIDLFVDQFGAHHLPTVDCFEPLFRRLHSVIYADWKGDWILASHMEESPEFWGSTTIMAEAIRAEKFQRVATPVNQTVTLLDPRPPAKNHYKPAKRQ